MSYDKPIPIPDTLSEGHWAAARSGVLTVQRCLHCSHYAHPPEPLCRVCRSLDARFEWQKVSGEGRLKSWTFLRNAMIPAFNDELPIAIGVVELREQAGLLMLGRIVPANAIGSLPPLSPGMPVTAKFEHVTATVSLVRFAPVAAA